jgi:hypothetical protein
MAILLANGKEVLEFRDANRRRRLCERGAGKCHRVHLCRYADFCHQHGKRYYQRAVRIPTQGFEDVMPAVSVRDAEKNVHLSKVEEDDR